MTPPRPAVALAAALASAGCTIDIRGDDRVVREEKRFQVGGEVDLTVRTFDGTIDVRGWDRNEVLVRIERRGSNDADLDALEVRAEQQDGRVVVEARDPRSRDAASGWSSPSVSFLVSTPRGAVVRARTGDGNVTTSSLTGSVELETGDGALRAERVSGRIRGRTGEGDVRMSGVAGTLELDAGAGDVEVDGRFEMVDVRSGEGRIVFEANRGSAMKKDWSIATGDGTVTVRLPEDFDAEVEARTGDGRVRVNGDGAEGRDERRVMRGTLGKGGRRLRLESGEGSIEIRTRSGGMKLHF
jgi:DUF4097 and DUF4098 domain-containing protein YvlB